MNNDIKKRLSILESVRTQKIPTFEEFQELWPTMDELSQALYIFDAEYCQETKYDKTIADYLRRMGVVTGEPKDIGEIAQEMENEA